jgi:hypothetical protein
LGLLMPSESEAPFEPFVWEGGDKLTPERLLPPPSPEAESLLRVQLVSEAVPWLSMPPPPILAAPLAESLLRVQLVSVTVPPLTMPPPSAS